MAKEKAKAKVVKLTWTPIQIEIARKLAEGKTLEQLQEEGYTRSLVFKIINSVKNGQRPPENQEPAPKPENPEKPKAEKPRTVGVQGKSGIEVGKITITPENWGMSQYGAVLILDTYNKAKRDLNYGGTVGDFLCDLCKLNRRIMNYEEVEYVPGSGTGDGGQGSPENASRVAEPQKSLTG